jgi:hypothetical protein
MRSAGCKEPLGFICDFEADPIADKVIGTYRRGKW